MNSATPPTIRKCANCGKTIGQNTRGSFTSWLFRKAECNCELADSMPDEGNKKGAVVLELDPIQALLLTPEERESTAASAAGTKISRIEEIAKVGDLIGGRYQVLNHIGSGGMASVYRVADKTSGQVYALKMLYKRDAKKESTVKRLEHEALATKNLTHANICGVYDFGVNADGAPYLVMEFVAGDNLDNLLKQEKLLDEKRTLKIFMQLAGALHYAHEQGVIHCDLKPSNVLLAKKFGEEELAKIVDFGIAKISDQHNIDKSKLMQTGEFIGSPLYMSPEQCRGDRLDRRSDIYSLACMIYELLIGTPPFSGENPIKVILKHLEEAPPPMPSDKVSRDLQEVLVHCLEKTPQARYNNAEMLLADLQKIASGKRIQTYRKKSAVKPMQIVLGLFVVVGIGFAALNMFSRIAPINQAWQLNQSSGQRFFNQGLYNEATAAFEEALNTPGTSASQKLKSIQALALISHLTHKTAAESSYITQMEKLDSSGTLAQPVTENASLAQLQNMMSTTSTEKEKKELAEQFSFAVLQEAYLLNLATQPDKAMELIESAKGRLESAMDPSSASFKNLELEEAYTLIKQGQQSKDSIHDPELKYAEAKSIIAQSFATNHIKQALALSKEAVETVEKSQLQKLDSSEKGRALEILDRHIKLITRDRTLSEPKTGVKLSESADVQKYLRLADSYRYDK